MSWLQEMINFFKFRISVMKWDHHGIILYKYISERIIEISYLSIGGDIEQSNLIFFLPLRLLKVLTVIFYPLDTMGSFWWYLRDRNGRADCSECPLSEASSERFPSRARVRSTRDTQFSSCLVPATAATVSTYLITG